MEGAAGGRVDRRGRVPREHDPLAPPLDLGVRNRDRAHQGARVGVAGPVDDLLGGPELDDLVLQSVRGARRTASNTSRAISSASFS